MTPSVTTLDNRLSLSPKKSLCQAAPAPGSVQETDITVAGSAQTVRWLSAIARQSDLPWRVRQLDGGVPHDLLVLTQPGRCAALRHWIAASRVVVSLDSPQGRSLALSKRVETFTFSEGRDAADMTAKDLRLTPSGLRFVAVTRSALTRVSVDTEELYPALAALACAVWLGAPLELAGDVISTSAASHSEKIIKMA